MSGGARICEGLRTYDLRALVRGDFLALRVPKFYSDSLCSTIAARAKVHPARGYYENIPALGRIGMAYYEAKTRDAKSRYYAQAAEAKRVTDPTYGHHPKAIDLLESALHDAWPAGACVEQIEDAGKMFTGILRICEAGSEARPHQDVLEWDAPPQCLAAKELITQLSANVYLEVSSDGGELELWGFGLDRSEYESLTIPGTFALDRNHLPKPNLQIRPDVGDLIIFNASKLHAVLPVRQGSRITVGTFIGVRSMSRPLTLWS